MNFDKANKQEKYDYLASKHIDTEEEMQFKMILHKHGIPFKQEVKFGKHRADFVIGSTIYEINGKFHYKKQQRIKDKKRASYILKWHGYDIKEITNEEVYQCFIGELPLANLLEPDTRSIDEKFKYRKNL